VVNFKKYEGTTKTKAFFDVEVEQGMVVKGFRLVEGKDGLFISGPREYSKKDEKWYDRVFMPRELKDELEEEAKKEYGVGTSRPVNEPF
ncbi:uncharacterized protein METZ01_LOCUS431611, partial [marine metagenome]